MGIPTATCWCLCWCCTQGTHGSPQFREVSRHATPPDSQRSSPRVALHRQSHAGASHPATQPHSQARLQPNQRTPAACCRDWCSRSHTGCMQEVNELTFIPLACMLPTTKAAQTCSAQQPTRTKSATPGLARKGLVHALHKTCMRGETKSGQQGLPCCTVLCEQVEANNNTATACGLQMHNLHEHSRGKQNLYLMHHKMHAHSLPAAELPAKNLAGCISNMRLTNKHACGSSHQDGTLLPGCQASTSSNNHRPTRDIHMHTRLPAMHAEGSHMHPPMCT